MTFSVPEPMRRFVMKSMISCVEEKGYQFFAKGSQKRLFLAYGHRKKLTDYKRLHLKTLVGLLTSHCKLRHHKNRIGLAQDTSAGERINSGTCIMNAS